MAKTKASKQWFLVVAVFAVILNVSYVEAKSLKKGEEYKEKNGEAIRVVSSDEVEIEHGSDIFLGKYTIDGERVRIVVNALGAAMVKYYKATPEGLVEEKTGKTYYSKAGLAAATKRTEEERRKADLAAGALKYKDNKNGTITDKDTKLLWQKGQGDRMDWDFATAYCKKLFLAGYNDWRLPDIEELKSIIEVGKTPAINKAYFPGTDISHYWSSTTNTDNSSLAWIVDFGSGYSDSGHKMNSYYVRCVRDEK